MPILFVSEGFVVKIRCAFGFLHLKVILLTCSLVQRYATLKAYDWVMNKVTFKQNDCSKDSKYSPQHCYFRLFFYYEGGIFSLTAMCGPEQCPHLSSCQQVVVLYEFAFCLGKVTSFNF